MLRQVVSVSFPLLHSRTWELLGVLFVFPSLQSNWSLSLWNNSRLSFIPVPSTFCNMTLMPTLRFPTNATKTKIGWRSSFVLCVVFGGLVDVFGRKTVKWIFIQSSEWLKTPGVQLSLQCTWHSMDFEKAY